GIWDLGSGKEKLKTRHPHIAQPEKIRHFPPSLPDPWSTQHNAHQWALSLGRTGLGGQAKDAR
ncbi:MAG: hypothetical protein ACFB11_18085, partial [Paracoccaceae bacterium]